jgi:membrane protein required for colicin V production
VEFNYFDLIASVIILLLGLKGILNGFFKEVFGLIGIIGGIFIASRVGDQVGQYLNDAIFNFQNPSAISFTGFLATLAAFWILMIIIGFIFKKLSILSGLGPIDKILGFVFGAGKFFLIAAVIAFAVFNIQAIRPTLEKSLQGSVLFPILVETGKFIMKIDPTEVTNEINSSIDETTQTLKENIQEHVTDEVNKTIENTVEKIQQTQQEEEKKEPEAEPKVEEETEK